MGEIVGRSGLVPQIHFFDYGGDFWRFYPLNWTLRLSTIPVIPAVLARGQFDPNGKEGKGLFLDTSEGSKRACHGQDRNYDEARRGWLYPLDLNLQPEQLFKMGEFNHYRIEALATNLNLVEMPGSSLCGGWNGTRLDYRASGAWKQSINQRMRKKDNLQKCEGSN